MRRGEMSEVKNLAQQIDTRIYTGDWPLTDEDREYAAALEQRIRKDLG